MNDMSQDLKSVASQAKAPVLAEVTEISGQGALTPVQSPSNLEPIQRLRGYYDSGEPVPWERVYTVPAFVQFPHRAHIRSQVECEECHGKVEEMDRVYKFSSLKMGWCLDCHWAVGEDTDVATDRLLIQQFPPPETPDERQPIGLYPRRLDQQYGANRGPIDCFACHY